MKVLQSGKNWYEAVVIDPALLGPGYAAGDRVYVSMQAGWFVVHSGSGLTRRILTKEQAASSLKTFRQDGKQVRAPDDVVARIERSCILSDVLEAI